MKNKKWKVGDTICYPYDFGFRHVVDIPVEVAINWLKAILPESKLGFSVKVKDVDLAKWNNYRQMSWMNKLLIVIDTPHYMEVIGLYNHDGRYSIVKLDLKENKSEK